MSRVADHPGLRRPVVAGVLGKAAEALTLVLLATLVPRVLGPADHGRLSVVLTVVAVGSVAMTLGGATLLGRYVPAAPAGERAPLARALTLRLARNRVPVFAVLAVTGVVAALLDPARFPPLAVACVVVALALNVAVTLALQADLGLGRPVAWSARYPVQNAVLVAVVLALYAAAGLDGTVVAVVVAAAAGAALAAAATGGLWRAPSLPVALPADAARFGLAQAGAGAATQVVQRGGVVAAALLSTADETGYAAVALGVALAGTYAVAQLFTLALPTLAARATALAPSASASATATTRPGPCPESHVADTRRRESGFPDGTSSGERALRRLAGWLLAVVLPAAVVGVALADIAVPLVLGPAYTGAAGAVGTALALVVLAPLAALTLQAAALRLRPEVTLAAATAGAAAFLAVVLAAVPAWGAAGAAAAALAGTVTTAGVATALLPGAVGWRIGVVSFAGAAVVAGWGVVA